MENDDVTMTEKRTWRNALIGAAVTVFGSFIPFSPILGGGVAGYLQKGSLEDGVTVGTLSGVFAAVLFGALGALFLVPFAFLGLFGARGGPPMAMFVLMGFVWLFYTVVLSVLGGAIGVYLSEETAVDEYLPDTADDRRRTEGWDDRSGRGERAAEDRQYSEQDARTDRVNGDREDNRTEYDDSERRSQ